MRVQDLTTPPLVQPHQIRDALNIISLDISRVTPHLQVYILFIRGQHHCPTKQIIFTHDRLPVDITNDATTRKEDSQEIQSSMVEASLATAESFQEVLFSQQSRLQYLLSTADINVEHCLLQDNLAV